MEQVDDGGSGGGGGSFWVISGMYRWQTEFVTSLVARREVKMNGETERAGRRSYRT